MKAVINRRCGLNHSEVTYINIHIYFKYTLHVIRYCHFHFVIKSKGKKNLNADIRVSEKQVFME